MPRAKADSLDKLSIYFPLRYQDKKPLQRLKRLAKKKDRSINYLVVQALIEFVKREEKAQAGD